MAWEEGFAPEVGASGKRRDPELLGDRIQKGTSPLDSNRSDFGERLGAEHIRAD